MTMASTLDGEDISAGLASIASAAPMQLQHFTLDNGLSVYLREDHSTPLVAVQLWYHVGSSYEPAGHTNISHVLEHLVFEGSSKLAAGQYNRVIARLGGYTNATSGVDGTAFEMLLPGSRLPVGLEIMADAMRTATFGQSEMEQGVKAVEDERRVNFASNVEEQAYNQHDQLAHGGSPYAQDGYAFPADLRNITLEALRGWYDTWYHPNNATLVVVGSIDLPTLQLQVSRYFSGLSKASLAKQPVPHHDARLVQREQTVTLPGLRHGVRMSFNVPGCATAPDVTTAPTLALICELLGKGSSSLLYGNLERTHRLISGVRVSYDPLVRGDTLLTITAWVNTGNSTPEQAAEAVYQVIDGLRLAPLPDEVLDRAKLRMLARQLFSLDDLDLQAERIGAAAAAGVSPTLLDRQSRIVRDLDSATLQKMAADYLGRERLTITYLRPGAAV
ncbi:insulinase family protein [Pseudomonas putida]|uniref:M16 family metallopeptidase n=1 Tax=Pseudomonas putida TaxID=303 RepID=UPI0018AB27C1|nr:pitrilysin family protein [Pseudomonas putida]MBF8672082.1 insulinase family protein [Pseudomonas putida]MBF8715462.1 insulinase family protein [Pseudomonas putida]